MYLPNLRIPKINITTPDRNASKTAKSGPWDSTYFWVISAMIAVGPIVMSLQLPKII